MQGAINREGAGFGGFAIPATKASDCGESPLPAFARPARRGTGSIFSAVAQLRALAAARPVAAGLRPGALGPPAADTRDSPGAGSRSGPATRDPLATKKWAPPRRRCTPDGRTPPRSLRRGTSCGQSRARFLRPNDDRPIRENSSAPPSSTRTRARIACLPPPPGSVPGAYQRPEGTSGTARHSLCGDE